VKHLGEGIWLKA